MEKLIVAICSYNRGARLPSLVKALRQQSCPIPFSILIVNNNSTDNTLEILQQLKSQSGPELRFVTEPKQGIAHARNRTISECLDLDATYMFVMDDDELPQPRILEEAYHSLKTKQFDCVGGKVEVSFALETRPKWLNEDLLGFLAETNYGDTSFTITDDSTPIWTANIAYRVEFFKQHPDLRFDIRYNREGKAVGGGEDVMMFNAWLNKEGKLAYNPNMVVNHYVESWRLKKSYFYKLHFTAGKKTALFELPEYNNKLLGIPLFLFQQAFYQSLKAITMYCFNHPSKVRQVMNATHAFGLIYGSFLKN